MAKKEVNINLILLIVLILIILFGQKPVSYGEAGRIARETLYNDPILGSLRERISIDLTSISDEGAYWRVQASIICQRNAQIICSDLRSHGISENYTVLVDKSSANALIIYPYYR